MTQERPRGVIEILQDELIALRDRLGEALVRENNLRAALEAASIRLHLSAYAICNGVADEIDKALANERKGK
jgi:hypothetical protein